MEKAMICVFRELFTDGGLRAFDFLALLMLIACACCHFIRTCQIIPGVHMGQCLRKRGDKLLHSKYLVSLVIILTIIDCSLVIAELILDLYSVKKTLLFTEGQTFKFIKSIRDKYPDQVRHNDSVASVYERMAYSTIIWNNSQDLDPYNSGDASNTIPTSASPLGMQHPFFPRVFTENNDQQPIWDPYSQTIHVEKGNSSTYYSTRRFRRSHKSNNQFKESNNVDHNERRTRPKTHLMLLKIVRRVKRYLHTGIKYISQNSIHDSNATASYNIDSNDNYADNWINRNNDSSRQIDDLIILQKQISEILTMQLNGSKDFQTGISRTAGVLDSNVVDDDDVVSQSTIYSIDTGGGDSGDRLSEDRSYSEDFSSEVSQDGGWRRGSNDKEEENEYRRSRNKRNSDNYEENMRRELQHSEEMEIAHKLHYASLCVSSVLVFEVTLKIICAGSHFLKKKIQVFDAVVIVTSVIVDLIFIKGLPEFAVDDSIFVLALLLPWRVIRVVNSLVMAVIDHEQVKLRLLYSRKKKLDKTVESLRNEIDEIKGTLQEIRSFCIKEGIESSQIDGMLGKFAPRRRKDSKFYTLVKLVMSTASINNNDNDSVSSTSIENDLRHYSNKDSVLNLAASSRGTMTSLKQYLSVPFSNDDSHSMSDGDSLAGDLPGLSPSIYITSPVSDDGRGILSFCDVDMDDNDVDMACMDSPGRNENTDKVATIAVTANTTNINTMNGVSFFVGSQTSLDIGNSQDNIAVLENEKPQQNNFIRTPPSIGISGEATSTTTTDANKNFHSRQFKQFLTVPNCEDGVPSGSNLSSNNNNASELSVVSETPTTIPLPQGSAQNEMKRSASENVNITLGFSHYEGKFSHSQGGSPSPIRRLPEVRTKRKIYSRSRSESVDNECIVKIKRDRSFRSRRNSEDPQGQPRGRNQDAQRARSHSPSPMLLSVPGSNNAISCSASRSMNDVSTTGNQYANNASDGVILRRSCLSLNSAGRKQRDKSPNRVSFKVS